MSVRAQGLYPVGDALAGVAQATAPYVRGAAWLPSIETEEAAFLVRLRGAHAIAADRHAVATENGSVSRADRVRVLVRIDGALTAFEAFYTMKREQKLEPVALLEGER